MRKALAVALVVAGCALGVAAVVLAWPKANRPGSATGPGRHAVGSVIGGRTPLRAYADIQPSVHLFGDTINARIAVVADTRFVDPSRLRVNTAFAPYTAVTPPQVHSVRAGRFEQLTWTWTLHCLNAKCVPVKPPSEKFHVFQFPQALVLYMRPNGTVDFQRTVAWPSVEVLSHLGPVIVSDLLRQQKYDWQYTVAPLPAPTFRIRPGLLFWLAMAAALAVFIAALALASRWYLAFSPRRAAVRRLRGTPLERALAVVTWAHAHGNETLERKAFERVADELGDGAAKDGLSETAHRLAWQSGLPDDAEVQAFARRAQEAGAEEPSE